MALALRPSRDVTPLARWRSVLRELLGRANPAAARQLGAILVRRVKDTVMRIVQVQARGTQTSACEGAGVGSVANLAARPGVRSPEARCSAGRTRPSVHSSGLCWSGRRARGGRAPQVVVSLRSLLQDRMAALNGRTVEYVLKQDLAAFVRLIGLSVAQVGRPGLWGRVGSRGCDPRGGESELWCCAEFGGPALAVVDQVQKFAVQGDVLRCVGMDWLCL